MLVMLAATCLGSTTLKIPWPNVFWISPLGKSGKHVVATSIPEKNGAIFRIWPANDDKPWFKTTFYENGPTAYPDGKHVLASGWGRAELFAIGSDKPVAKGYSAGLVNGKPAALKYDERKNTTYLQYQGKQILPPGKRDFLMIAQQGEWIATERQALPGSKGEDQYRMIIELWRLTPRHRLEFVRSLGEHWWDSGSSGTPSILSVAGNRLAFVDHPGGGNVMQFTRWVPPNKGSSNPFDKNGMGMTEVSDAPIAFEKGLVGKMWVIDTLSHQNSDLGREEKGLFSYAEWCLAWMDGKDIKLSIPPEGFLNGWVNSPNEMGYVAEANGHFEVKKMSLPPIGWWKPTKGLSGATESRSILSIAWKEVMKHETWIKEAEFDKPRKTSDGTWLVSVHRLPKTPGGSRFVRISKTGRVIDYVRGL